VDVHNLTSSFPTTIPTSEWIFITLDLSLLYLFLHSEWIVQYKIFLSILSLFSSFRSLFLTHPNFLYSIAPTVQDYECKLVVTIDTNTWPKPTIKYNRYINPKLMHFQLENSTTAIIFYMLTSFSGSFPILLPLCAMCIVLL
jgi:hypothetical protein